MAAEACGVARGSHRGLAISASCFIAACLFYEASRRPEALPRLLGRRLPPRSEGSIALHYDLPTPGAAAEGPGRGGRPSAPGSCLNFLHIPKTAGTSVELSARKSGVLWGRYDRQLNCSNRSKSTCQNQVCPVWHMPPSFDSMVRESYRPGNCTTFCIVRHPVRRLISEATFRGVPCNEQELSRYITWKLQHPYRLPAFTDDCHRLPQSEFVYGGLLRVPHRHAEDSAWPTSTPGHYCQRVLKFENLILEFAELMREFDLSVEFEHVTENTVQCRSDVDQRTKELVRRRHAADFEIFGYEV